MSVTELDGLWKVKRAGGFLPPLIGVRKLIYGQRGETQVGRVCAVPFRVEGKALRYCRPFESFVDLIEPDENGFEGKATFRGREFGRFVMRRIADEHDIADISL